MNVETSTSPSIEYARITDPQTGRVFLHALRRRHRFDPVSACFALIDTLLKSAPADARRLLRLSIELSKKPEPCDRLLIKIAAKRFSIRDLNLGPIRDSTGTELSEGLRPQAMGHLNAPERFESIADARRYLTDAVSRLADPSTLGEAARSRPRFERSRPIAALLMGPDLRVLACAKNTSAESVVRHAEINLIISYLERHSTPPPAGSILLTTLSPCRMCAGWIHHLSDAQAPLRVLYLERDLGPAAQGTLLERDSSDRRWLGINDRGAPLAEPFAAEFLP